MAGQVLKKRRLINPGRRRMSPLQIKYFGTKRQKAGLRNARKRKKLPSLAKYMGAKYRPSYASRQGKLAPYRKAYQRNAGPYSRRKTKKRLKKQGISSADIKAFTHYRTPRRHRRRNQSGIV